MQKFKILSIFLCALFFAQLINCNINQQKPASHQQQQQQATNNNQNISAIEEFKRREFPKDWVRIWETNPEKVKQCVESSEVNMCCFTDAISVSVENNPKYQSVYFYGKVSGKKCKQTEMVVKIEGILDFYGLKEGGQVKISMGEKITHLKEVGRRVLLISDASKTNSPHYAIRLPGVDSIYNERTALNYVFLSLNQ